MADDPLKIPDYEPPPAWVLDLLGAPLAALDPEIESVE